MELSGKVLGVFVDQVNVESGDTYHSVSFALPGDIVGSLTIADKATAEKILTAITEAEAAGLFETVVISGYDLNVKMETKNGVNQPVLAKSGSRIARLVPIDGETQAIARGERVPRHVKAAVAGW